MMKYKAFGLVLDSEFELPQVPVLEEDVEADVRICYSELSKTGKDFSEVTIEPAEFYMCPQGLANMRVTNGNLIEVEPLKKDELAHIFVFIMGSCMGAILHQRELFPLHGSCVTDGKRSVMITGDSGAGKSTLASEFLSRGWKLLTDDVAVILGVDENKPIVQSSYPSQKLWADSLAKYEHQSDSVHSLYAREDELKYGVNVSKHFYEGTAPLSMIVRLVPNEEFPTEVIPVVGFGKVEQVRYNTYRKYMVVDKNKYLQRCINLGTKVEMAVAYRHVGEPCADILYEKIVKILDAQTQEA